MSIQIESAARWTEMIDKSGELRLPSVGSFVRLWSLIVIRLLLLMLSFSVSPRCYHLTHVVVEYQAS